MARKEELLFAIRRISHHSTTVEEATDGIETALKTAIGHATLLVQPESEGLSPFAVQAVSSFLNSGPFPFRGVYTASSRIGRLIICLGAFQVPDRQFQKLTNEIAAELGALSMRQTRKAA